MSKQVSLDPQKRQRTRHRGITYRLRADGSRSYSVYFRGKYLAAGSTEKEALAKQAELRRRQGRGEKVIVNDRTTFAEVAEQWYSLKAGRLRKSTRDGYRRSLDLVLLPRFGDWRLTAIDADAIAELVRDLEREGRHAIDPTQPARVPSRSTIENYLKPLQGVLGLAVRRGLIASNPFDHLTSDDRPKRTANKEPHMWTDEEIDALLAASRAIAAESPSRYDYTDLLMLTARLGLRVGEVTGLQWQDFDATDSTLTVRRQWSRFGEYEEPKTNAGRRRIPLPDDLRELLIERKLRTTQTHETDPIFASSNGTPLDHRNVAQRGFDTARKRAGIEGVSFHDLRHAAASRLINAGLSPVAVAAVLGHASPVITLNIYAHLFDRQKTDEAVRAALTNVSEASATDSGETEETAA